jgi:hypothetical protein
MAKPDVTVAPKGMKKVPRYSVRDTGSKKGNLKAIARYKKSHSRKGRKGSR